MNKYITSLGTDRQAQQWEYEQHVLIAVASVLIALSFLHI